jgi:hypothetical protein
MGLGEFGRNCTPVRTMSSVVYMCGKMLIPTPNLMIGKHTETAYKGTNLIAHSALNLSLPRWSGETCAVMWIRLNDSSRQLGGTSEVL